MHSSVHNRDESSSILSLKEIVSIVVIFSLVLYLLFPKGNIDEIIKEKGKNTNLSINYLESMLLYYPDSIKLQMILIENYSDAGEIDKALKLTREVIAKSKDLEKLDKLYKTEYMLMRDLYFKKKDKKLREEMRDKLYDYFEFTEGRRDYMFLLAEAEQMDFTNLKYVSLNGLMRQRPELQDYVFEKKSYYLAQMLGYKDEAYYSLLRLIEYEEVEDDISKYALSSLLERREYEKAKLLATKLFLNSSKKEEAISFFNIAIYASIQNSSSGLEAIDNLIELYQGDKELDAEDIYTILKTLLEVNHLKGATAFAMRSFSQNSDAFDMKTIDLAIDSLVYNSRLEDALMISRYAHYRFKKQKYLDRAIQLATWLGDRESLAFFNESGYKEYKDLKYERYLLNSTTMNFAHEIRGKIYKQRVEKGDYSFVDRVAKYYTYIGEIAKGEEYFYKLLKKSKNKKVYRYAIEFAYYNSHYQKGLKLYEEYKKRYKIDKDLQEHSIKKLLALKEFKKAYEYAKELKEHKMPFKQRVLTDLLSIQKDYPYLYTMLWEKEQKVGLVRAEYEKLIPLEKEFNKGRRVAYLYKKLWQNSSNRAYLFALLYLYMEKRDFDEFKTIIDRLSLNEKRDLDSSIEYNILMANYFIEKKEIKKALKRFKKALILSPYNPQTHQAYLWFLMDNHFNKSLKKELRVLRKNPILQSRVGFPSVVLAMVLQKTDLALRWLKPLLDSDNLEYQILYADILELQDRAEGAKKVRLALFKRVNQMIKDNPKLLKNREFARVYMRLVTLYINPYERRAVYFEQFKSLFKNSDYMEMKISWYASKGQSAKVKELVRKYKIDIPWLNLYLALSYNNQKAKQNLVANYKEVLPFRDRVIATLDTGNRDGAYSLAFMGLEDNSQDVELYKIFYTMANQDYPKTEFKSKFKQLNSKINLLDNKISYRWRLYKGIESKLVARQREFIKKGKKSTKDNSLLISFKNRDKKLLWDFSLERHNTKNDYLSSSLDLKYKLSNLTLALSSKYQNPTKQTVALQLEGMENSLEFRAKKSLSNRINVGLSTKVSQYKKQNGDLVGNSNHIQLNSNYILRAGYPDINFNTYLGINRYSSVITDSFWELGTQLSFGANSKNSFHRSWRPFGTVSIGVNGKDYIGTNLSLGLSGMLLGGDILSLSFDYSQGMGVVSEPVYGGHLEYRF